MQAAIIATCAAAAIGGFWFVLRKQREVPAALQDRDELTVSDVYRDFFADVGMPLDRFTTLWEEIAEAFRIPPGRIRPTDRFGVELPFRPMMGTTDEDLFLFRALQRRVGKSAAKDALPKLQTVDQFVRFLAAEAK